MIKRVKDFIETNYELLDSDAREFIVRAKVLLFQTELEDLLDVLHAANIHNHDDIVEQSLITDLKWHFQNLKKSLYLTEFVSKYLYPTTFYGKNKTELFDFILEHKEDFEKFVYFDVNDFGLTVVRIKR